MPKSTNEFEEINNNYIALIIVIHYLVLYCI